MTDYHDRLSLLGRTALVTGASRGIGRAIARRLAEAGADVAINFLSDDSRSAGEALRHEIGQLGRKALVVQADASSKPQIDAMFAQVEAELGPVQILVNNAGIDPITPIATMDEAEWDRVLDVNLKGPFLCLQRALVRMQAGGSVINVSSIHDATPRIGSSHYSASKAGLDMLTKTAALELGPRGIRVNAIAPGAILTDINRERVLAMGEEAWRRWIPLGRVGDAAEIADFAAFLASDAASYITGAVIYVDGGYRLPLVRHAGWPAELMPAALPD
jgi:NAD(P)-dependent dehydrogenase (short-subunit alcohol dehydrogenase family)